MLSISMNGPSLLYVEYEEKTTAVLFNSELRIIVSTAEWYEEHVKILTDKLSEICQQFCQILNTFLKAYKFPSLSFELSQTTSNLLFICASKITIVNRGM